MTAGTAMPAEDPESTPALDIRPLQAGSRLGRYQIARRLAVGGMAELYLARADGSGAADPPVAIKRVHPHLAQGADFAAMFHNEARIAATLRHPNIVRVLEIGTDPDEQFFAMEYLHGENVRTVLAEACHRGGIPLPVALAIVIGAARGLHHAHERTGVVHRDVSPSNVIVTFDGGVKVVDFGIAKTLAQTQQTRAGVVKGKIGYMSPEQCRGEPVDRRSDVFGLGVLLYETTTAQRLFFAENQFAIMNKIVMGEFDKPSDVVPDYPARLEAIALRALAVEPQDRFPSAKAMLDAVEEFAVATDSPIGAEPVRAFLRELFGAKEFPSILPLEEITPAKIAAPPSPRTSKWTWAALGALPIALGLGVILGGGLTPEAQPVAAPEAPPNPVAVPPVEPKRVEPVPPAPEPVVAEPPAAAPPAVEEPEPQKQAPKRKPKRGKRKKQAKGANPLFPKGYYQGR